MRDHAPKRGVKPPAVVLAKRTSIDRPSLHVNARSSSRGSSEHVPQTKGLHHTYGEKTPRAAFGVVHTSTARFASVILLSLLIFQPIYTALAMELPQEGSGGDTGTETGEISSSSGSPGDKTETSQDGALPDESSEDASLADDMSENSTSDDDKDDPGNANGGTDQVEESDLSVPEENESEIEAATSTEPTGEGAATSTPETGDNETASAAATSTPSSEPGPVDDYGGSIQDETDREGADEDTEQDTEENAAATSTDETSGGVATTTDSQVSNNEEIATTTVSETLTYKSVHESAYAFDEGECTLVAEGEFYCVQREVRAQYTPGSLSVIAEIDREGDREIYVVDKDGDRQLITNNSYDDFAPVLDESEGVLVWHSMIRDRLQVMYHDLETGETKQLTSGTENNSNPHIFGDRVVWQGWVENNWEIFMADDVDDEDFEVTKLTENSVHDMFPQVYDGIITWQTEAGGAWEIVVYDMISGERSRLRKEGDGRYENPRFVLLFENRTKEGDVETIGYDVETGEMMPLGARPGKEKPVEPVVPQDHQDAVPVAAATSTVKTERRDSGEE